MLCCVFFISLVLLASWCVYTYICIYIYYIQALKVRSSVVEKNPIFIYIYIYFDYVCMIQKSKKFEMNRLKGCLHFSGGDTF